MPPKASAIASTMRSTSMKIQHGSGESGYPKLPNGTTPTSQDLASNLPGEPLGAETSKASTSVSQECVQDCLLFGRDSDP